MQKIFLFFYFFFLWLDSPIWAWASSFRRGFMVTHIRHTTVGRTPLDEGPARRRDLYLTTHNTHKSLGIIISKIRYKYHNSILLCSLYRLTKRVEHVR
jgi:hypothetical protein